MISKWYELKDEAIEMRLAGNSINDVSDKLGIPKSTLSGWLKEVKISKKHQKVLLKRWKSALVNARIEAVKWHNNQKSLRLKKAENEAIEIIEKIDIKNKELIEIILSILYLGEGSKKNSTMSMGNSDPLILLLFITVSKKIYNFKNTDFICHLHLRADQDSSKMIEYWSKILSIPKENFGKTSKDQRTLGRKTYDSYNGVCVVKCGNVAIQRKLIYLSRMCCEKIIETLGG